jgi:hypothetical protein
MSFGRFVFAKELPISNNNRQENRKSNGSEFKAINVESDNSTPSVLAVTNK